MTEFAPNAVSGVPAERMPRHIAIIMDGNGRWAARRGEPRIFGHREGAATVDRIVTECRRLGIEALTLYSFSSENWKRPADEVDALMALYVEYLARERPRMIEQNIRFRQIGRRAGLSDEVRTEVERTERATAHGDGLTLVLAVNYGARAEITDAVRAIATRVRDGELDVNDIEEATVDAHLYTAGLPDPDLLVRTSGEYRLSNYLLWQISYAEIHVTDVLWPEFDADALHDAIRDYAARDRRFGGVAREAGEQVESRK